MKTIVQLNGGLGNQLFQYALGRALSLMHKIPIYYDTSFLGAAYAKRSCELEFFQTHGNFGSFAIHDGQYVVQERKRYNIIGDKLGINTGRYNYHNHILKGPMPAYISGFWQSYKYFDHIRDILLKDIVPVQALDNDNQLLVSQMHNENSVAIHIRRGDFQKVRRSTIHMRGKHWHTIIGLDYYYKAIDHIRKSVSNPVFYIFSNDIKWCKDNFTGAEFHFVEYNTGLDSYKDMVLMSQCKHNIICNSTFSWRGAYLNQHKNTLTIAPKKWYDAAIDTSDLLLPHWTVL